MLDFSAFEVRSWVEEHLQVEVCVRDDDLELSELIIKFLGGQVKR